MFTSAAFAQNGRRLEDRLKLWSVSGTVSSTEARTAPARETIDGRQDPEREEPRSLFAAVPLLRDSRSVPQPAVHAPPRLADAVDHHGMGGRRGRRAAAARLPVSDTGADGAGSV